MNLDNFSEKLRITVDAAFNYAKDNNFGYFLPIHLLIILLQDDNLISKILLFFSIKIWFFIKSSKSIVNYKYII